MQKAFKKIAVLLSAMAALVLVGAGCGGSQNADTSAPGDTGSEQSSGVAAKPETIMLSGVKAATKYFDTQSDVEVKSVTLNYQNDKAMDPGEGRKYVRLEMTVTNTGTKPFMVTTVNYRLNTSKEIRDYAYLIDTQVVNDLLTDQELAPGKSVTGAIYYEADMGETVDTMGLVYEGSEQITVPFKK